MDYKLSLRDAAAVEARPLGEAFHGRSKDGTELSVNSYYMENCRRIIETRTETKDRLTALGFAVVPSKANFLFAKSPDIPGAVLYEALRERGILVRHFDKAVIDQYNRITIGTREEMQQFLSAVEEILREYK